MSEHDITIHFGNKPSYNRFKTAIDVQDAGNLRALAREFVKVVDQAADDTQSTKATWEDPAVVMFVNKFESLCRSEERFSVAYNLCRDRSGLNTAENIAADIVARAVKAKEAS